MTVRAAVERLLAPGYSCCLRCRRPWRFAREHVTGYEAGRGCFALCECCWRTLDDPEARMPYYRELWEQWLAHGTNVLWQTIELAVRTEGSR